MMVFNINKIAKRILLLLIVLVLLSLSGCYELGDYTSDEAYFEYFPSVELIEKDKSSKSYSVKDYFYTEEGINDYETDVPYKEYLYLAIKVDKDLLLNEFNLSFCGDTDGTLQISIFILDKLPSNIRGYNDPLYDEEGNEIEYDDPTEVFASKVIHLAANEWISAYILNYSKNEYITINQGQYIVLRFENNSFSGKESGLNVISFTTTNLLIRTQGS